jgi:hypothetical protein
MSRFIYWHHASFADAARWAGGIGVYVIRDALGFRSVGSGDLRDRLSKRLGAQTRYDEMLIPEAWWGEVYPASDREGVEAYLGDVYKPREGYRFPSDTPIEVNLPVDLDPIQQLVAHLTPLPTLPRDNALMAAYDRINYLAERAKTQPNPENSLLAGALLGRSKPYNALLADDPAGQLTLSDVLQAIFDPDRR